MDRKGITSVVLAVLVLLAWQFYVQPKYFPLPPTPPGGASTAAGSPAPAGSPGAQAAVGATSSAGATLAGAASASLSGSAPAAHVPETLTSAVGPNAVYHFTNLGGGILRAELSQYTAESGSVVTLNEFGTMPIGAISDNAAVDANLPYTVTQTGNTIVCTRAQTNGISISKTFTLATSGTEAGGYSIALDVTFTNNGAQPVQSPGYYLYIGSAAPIHQRDLAYYTALDWCPPGGKQVETNVTYFNAGSFLGYETHPARPSYTADAPKIGWAAISGQFFTMIVSPVGDTVGNGIWARQFPVNTETRTNLQGIEGALRMPAFSLPPGKSVTQSYQIYAGPKIYSVLNAMGNGQEQILKYGMWKYISVFLLTVMKLIHGWVGNYAIAIIIMTLVIRAILWPIQNRSTQSMRQMQEIQPRMTELKEKYKDDPARMNTEVMKLYKEYNINPLAGCIPMLIQMPIFFGFYRVLGTAIELRGTQFLWVHDLSQPDTVFHIFGFAVNILPLCMAGTMLAQMSLQPKTGDQAQQRMMMFMPLLFVAFCYNYASALALYYTVQNIFTIAQLYVTRKKTAPAPVKPPTPKRRR